MPVPSTFFVAKVVIGVETTALVGVEHVPGAVVTAVHAIGQVSTATARPVALVVSALLPVPIIASVRPNAGSEPPFVRLMKRDTVSPGAIAEIGAAAAPVTAGVVVVVVPMPAPLAVSVRLSVPVDVASGLPELSAVACKAAQTPDIVKDKPPTATMDAAAIWAPAGHEAVSDLPNMMVPFVGY